MLARTATASFELDGYRIPKDAMIIISPADSHRLPDQFADPDQYRPDRYVADSRGMQQLTGFGGGIHRCLGVHFAYLEMKVILTRLLQRYDLELCTHDPQPVPGTKTKWPQSPCRVRYRARATAPI
jgi:sterol 14alpha-demethylase